MSENPFINHLSQVFSQGINHDDPKILGYHGTSLQTLMFAAKNGYLPVTSGSEKHKGGTHDQAFTSYGKDYSLYGIHLVPNPNNKDVKEMLFKRTLETKPYKQAQEWAKWAKGFHSQFEKYGLDINNPEHHRIAMDLEAKPNKEEVVKQHKLPKPLQNFTHGAVVLAISDEVMHNFQVNMGADGDDLNIITKKLPIQFIIGIEPQDDETYNYLDNLLNLS
jgi:hypothetical protein